MTSDVRDKAAKFYDLNPNLPIDIPFYEKIISSEKFNVLELGCGTGRIILSLAMKCRYIHGIDNSEAMLSICRKKLKEAKIPPNKANVAVKNIANFSLDQNFDFIIAPFRVLQNLESDTEIKGLFRCLKKHLTTTGSCILNVFKPNKSPISLQREWQIDTEFFIWEIPYNIGVVRLYVRKSDFNLEPLILYPEMIYRYYENDILKEEEKLKIPMRCYYPEEFKKLISAHGFKIINKWDGYSGEVYGEGSELIIQFTNDR